MKSKASVVLALLLVFGVGDATAAELTTSLKMQDGHIVYSIENRGKQSVHVYAVDFVDPHRSNHWLYMYDPATKKIRYGWGTVFQSPAQRAAEPPSVLLRPQTAMSKKFDMDRQILGLFMVRPECFYLVAVYRDGSGKAKTNVVSNALYLCQPSAP